MSTFFNSLPLVMPQPRSTSRCGTTLYTDGLVSADVETFMASSQGHHALNLAQALWEKEGAKLELKGISVI